MGEREVKGAAVPTWLSEVWSFILTGPGSSEEGLLHCLALPSATPSIQARLSFRWLLLYPLRSCPSQLAQELPSAAISSPWGLASKDTILHSPFPIISIILAILLVLDGCGGCFQDSDVLKYGMLTCLWGKMCSYVVFTTPQTSSPAFFSIQWHGFSPEAILVWISLYEWMPLPGWCILTVE